MVRQIVISLLYFLDFDIFFRLAAAARGCNAHLRQFYRLATEQVERPLATVHDQTSEESAFFSIFFDVAAEFSKFL